MTLEGIQQVEDRSDRLARAISIVVLIVFFVAVLRVFLVQSYTRELSSLKPGLPCARLGSYQAIWATAIWNSIQCNRASSGSPIVLNGVTYESGYGMHAESSLIFYRPPERRREETLKATFGMPDFTSNTAGSVTATIRVDSWVVWYRELIRPGEIGDLEVKIPEGASLIEFNVNDAGNGITSDDFAWVNPRIE